MGDVRVSLLGGFGAEVDGVAVPPKAWRLKKARELVKLLALAPGHRLHREQAMDVLWRDLAPAAAANNLHQAVHVARRTLDAEAIELRDEVLSLTADIDVDRFERRGRERTPPRDARGVPARRSRSTAASSCRRTATTTGPRPVARSSRRWRPSSRREAAELGPRSRSGCLPTRARSSAAARS